MAAEARFPDSVYAAYGATEPPGMVRELHLCNGPSGPVYWLLNATGYEDESVFFDADGQEVGHLIEPDSGPLVGSFDRSTLTGCETVLKREM